MESFAVTDVTDAGDAAGAGLGESQRAVLHALKRSGVQTVPELAAELGLNIETLRHHVRSLIGLAVVERKGTRRHGPGRPEVLYGLTERAESLFPRREGEILRQLATFLKTTNNEALLRSFFDHYIDERRAESLARVEGLEGRARLDEAAAILTELGFMAVTEDHESSPRLRLCHCPLRELVEATSIPCRAEIGFIGELLGKSPSRLSYIPSGDASCCYAPAP